MTKLAEKLAAAKRGEEIISGSMTVDAWYNQWISTYKEPKGLTAKSLGMYGEKYRKYIKPRIGHLKLRDVRDIHLQRILNEQEGMSASHAKKIRMVLQEMFKRARQSRLIVYDPAELLELPAVTEGKRRSITETERAAILAVAETHRAGLWVFTLLYTGMRPGETAALTWADVDFKHNEIHVHAAKESGSTVIKSPKTASGVRDIPIYTLICNGGCWRPREVSLNLYSPRWPGINRTRTVYVACGRDLSAILIFTWGQRSTGIKLYNPWLPQI